MTKTFILCILTSFFASLSFAQPKYKNVDDLIAKAGSMDSANVAQIAVSITRPFADNEEKARAIYYWITNNIAIDPKAVKSNNQKFSLPEDVIKNRKATALGFAKLFQEMSSTAKIRCLVVDGFTRNNSEDINTPADEINHSWNVVQLGQSPDQWFYVDAFKGSGYLDDKMSLFTPKFTNGYFFAEKSLFNLDHYPDNDAWQLGNGPKGMKSFFALPIVYNTAYDLGVTKITPYNGFIKTKTNAKVNFSFPVSGNLEVKNVSLLIGEGRRQQKPEPMNYSISDGNLVFDYQFKNEDTYPVKITVNGKPMLEYIVESNE